MEKHENQKIIPNSRKPAAENKSVLITKKLYGAESLMFTQLVKKSPPPSYGIQRHSHAILQKVPEMKAHKRPDPSARFISKNYRKNFYQIWYRKFTPKVAGECARESKKEIRAVVLTK
jgi:hypothetical protein